MGFLSELIGGAFKPIADVVEHVLPSGDAKVQLQKAILDGQLQIAEQTLDYKKEVLDSQAKIIAAEAQGNSWVQRSWRPITMLTFLSLTVCDSFNWLPNRLAPEAWQLLQIGLGGYVVGRSVEKTVPAVVAAISSRSNTPAGGNV